MATRIPTTDVVVKIEEVVPGDVFGGVKVDRTQHGKRWSYLYAPKTERGDHFIQCRPGVLVTVARKVVE
jgi:hypothetical protein